MSIRTVQPGEQGCDFSYSKPPPQLLVDLGYTFCAGYSSYNTTGKNCDNPQPYIDAGIAYVDLWEVSQTSTNGGYNVGAQHGLDAAISAKRKGVPAGLAIVACNDTNTTAATVAKQAAYMDGFLRHCAPYDLGVYDDTDLATVIPDWKLGILPSAWGWSVSIGPKLPNESFAEYWLRGWTVAAAKATALGYHVLQGQSFKLNGLYNVDPLTCIKPFQAWGNPLQPKDTTMDRFKVLVSSTYPTGGYSVYVHDVWDGTKRGIGLPEWDALGYPDAIPADVRKCSDADLAAIPDWKPLTVTVPPIVIPPINLADMNMIGQFTAVISEQS